MRWLRSPIARIAIGIAMIAAAIVVGEVLGEVLGIPGGARDLIGLVAAVGAYAGFARWLEQRRLDEFAPRRAPELVAGFAIGAALIATTMFVLWLLGVATFSWGNAALGTAAIAAAVSSVTEELGFRAIGFRILNGWL